MYPKRYAFFVPERGVFCIPVWIPFFTSSNRYFLLGKGTAGELITNLLLSAVLFAIALLYARRRFPILIMDDYFETKNNRYMAEEIKELKLHRRTGWVSIKLHKGLDSKKFMLRKKYRPEAVEVMMEWASRNKVNCSFK
ncbi:hypothetical protein [Cohnella zeiphila]|uniref:Uncharacterized protein n=1 Tax=Cohnella zeiphila TaxID=2761120 RepID=A0A7X0SMD2_9BACL|nr:hypothetical protein [Cohnella zeiphila]MBB6731504.1 hypothetical protein [Cohnella zeiphila]